MLLFIFSCFILFGCASNNNTINIQPNIQLPKQDPSLMSLTVNIHSIDKRTNNILAKINRRGKLVILKPSRDLCFLLQEVLEKQMIARGYMIGTSPIEIQIIINTLHTQITQGNMLYTITTKVDLSIISTAKNGNKLLKKYCQTHSTEGVFIATNQKIANVLNSTINDIISNMAQDLSIHNFIKQNSK
ncbi:YajG family lipoprotein [Pantoea sp. Aalb]|uniref:YajG family lipoprotein n=1 Tax=Pantoea sp. Aalb TaxID=2576762 RepID=UPI001F33584C|nr:YajG family lipoprotein [Pantoea sp. Aalb]